MYSGIAHVVNQCTKLQSYSFIYFLHHFFVFWLARHSCTYWSYLKEKTMLQHPSTLTHRF